MIRANFIHTLRTTLCAALSLGLVACTGVDKDTIGDSESEGDTTSAGATTGESVSSTSGDSSTGDAGSDTNAGGDTEGNTSTTGTTGDVSTSSSSGSTGGASDGIPESCKAACEVVYVCLADEYESMEECVAECVDTTTPDEPNAECEAAVVGFNECVAVGSCEDIGSENFCAAELDLLDELCDIGGGVCSLGVGGDAESCGIIQECEEGSMELQCAGESCLCLVDGEEVDSCDNDICVDELDSDALFDKALSCCGFEF